MMDTVRLLMNRMDALFDFMNRSLHLLHAPVQFSRPALHRLRLRLRLPGLPDRGRLLNGLARPMVCPGGFRPRFRFHARAMMLTENNGFTPRGKQIFNRSYR